MVYSRDQRYAKPHESSVEWSGKESTLLHGQKVYGY